ncbi:hypothetical protein XBFFL1_1450044 [Xenorhabdus bovienii str. feltiae Florida]|nr:hypothetical protein XBFFR1_2460043 [Xenorhabdus bovienii str. feltiae France]CDG91345.1 hypothetical protein XBFFL1_1450044 [Xenorhabdus bovienii str. feltiae Florida]
MSNNQLERDSSLFSHSELSDLVALLYRTRSDKVATNPKNGV